ncbi:MAG: hypothetical protein KAJ19_04265 [Gammaproteobacteria bacterium]|nr:hypothetical protein [Gammaproteobacteria bacterium]
MFYMTLAKELLCQDDQGCIYQATPTTSFNEGITASLFHRAGNVYLQHDESGWQPLHPVY